MKRARAAVVLAAGASRRMGPPKGLLTLGGEPLVRAHARALALAADRVVVVVGREAEAHRAAVADLAEIVANPDWATTWPADSLRRALIEADVRGDVFVTPVDVGPASLGTLQALLDAGAPAVPTDRQGRDGHPVLLDAAIVGDVRREAPDGGLRALLAGARRVVVEDPLVSLDFDDPEAWEAFLAARRGG